MTATIHQMLQKARRAVLRRGVPYDDADDLVQEAYLRVEQFERKHKARSQEALLVSAAVNLSIDRARRQSRSPFAEPDCDLLSIADATPLPDEIVRAQDQLRHAAEGLDQLNEETRRMLLSHRIDGLTYDEIGQREGMNPKAVQKRVLRATLFLLKWMDEW